MSHMIDSDARATNVRYHVLAATTAASIILYVHRAFVSEILKFDEVRNNLHLTKADDKLIHFAFFFSYALLQVPLGSLADRFGRRLLLAVDIVVWSIVTAMVGIASSVGILLVLRLILGIAQAGAYPAAGGLIGRWFPLSHRAKAISVVTSGGRIGGIITPLMTSLLIAQAGMRWQVVILLYGLVGIAIGIWYWIVVCDEPVDHPSCNESEKELIAFGRVAVDPNAIASPVTTPIRALLTSRSIWCMAISQFGTNIGWAFIITTMPRYFTDARGASNVGGGGMTSMIWALGAIGMLLGGGLTDRMTRRFGMRWGRIGTMIATRFISAAFIFLAMKTDDVWQAAYMLAAMSFFCDLGIPAAWAFAQDVGGRSVGAVLGFSNMVGNLGAAVAATFYEWSDIWLKTEKSMEGTLYCAMVGFLVAGVSALGIDASKPLVPEESDVPADIPKKD